MSKKHPSEAEARWRANYRYRRMRTTYLREVEIGDPLDCAEMLRKAGATAAVQRAIMATTTCAGPSGAKSNEGARGAAGR